MLNNRSVLLPHEFQIGGWWLLGVAIVSGIACVIANVSFGGLSAVKELTFLTFNILIYLSLLLLCVSKEKNEDEYISSLRARSVFIVVVYALVVKILMSIVAVVSVRFGAIQFLGYVSYLNATTKILVLSAAYLVIFKASLLIENLKLKKYNGQ